MRVNEPINDRELDFPDGEPLVSRTDPGGRIEFANHVFVEVSGFTEQELVGSAHNIVRHPHMPPAAFADLWATIKADRPWDGLVKNRAKSGAFYWVRANVTPVVQDGAVTGFISIRCKPSRQQIAAADQVYSALRAGTAKGIALSGGDVVRLGPRAWLGTLWHSVRGRLLAVTLAAVLVTLAVGWLGFAGMAASNDALRRVYERDLVAVNGLRTISDRIRDNRNHMAQLTIALGRGDKPEQVLAEREPAIRANMAQIAGLLSAYRETPLVPGQSALLQKFDAQYSALLRDGIEPALAFARRGEGAQLDQLFQKRLPPVFQAAFDTDRDLVNMQIELGRTAYTAATESLHWRLIAGALAGLAGLAAVLGLGWMLFTSVRGCTVKLEAHLTEIMQGDYAAEISKPKAREFHHVTRMLRAMRAHLAFARWQREEFERRAAIIRRETVDKMAHTIEQEAGAAVNLVADRTGSMARDADAMAVCADRVSTHSQHVAEAADNALKNAQVVASASEQLAASIREVSAQVDHASSVARGAAARGADARDTIRSLSDAADRIGAVVRLIADIAAKTNLLAFSPGICQYINKLAGYRASSTRAIPMIFQGWRGMVRDKTGGLSRVLLLSRAGVSGYIRDGAGRPEPPRWVAPPLSMRSVRRREPCHPRYIPRGYLSTLQALDRLFEVRHPDLVLRFHETDLLCRIPSAAPCVVGFHLCNLTCWRGYDGGTSASDRDLDRTRRPCATRGNCAVAHGTCMSG